MADFSVRPVTVEDSEALAQLTADSPDTGKVSVAVRFHVPIVDAVRALHPEAMGVVAEAPDGAGLAGAAWVDFGRCRFEGDEAPYALLNSLTVHPGFRRRGVASELTRWRLAQVEARDPATIVMASIQTGNRGSFANANRWAQHYSRPVLVTPVPMRRRPPRRARDAYVDVRAVAEDELAQFADGVNAFYGGFSLSRRQTAEELVSWLGRTPVGRPVNHLVAAVDRAGRILAGVALHEEARVSSMDIVSMPRMIRLANIAAKIVPADRQMRNLQASMAWFAPGQLAAGRRLWEDVRWSWRDNASSIVITVDPRSPVREMMQRPRWLPSTSVQVALRSPCAPSPERLLDPPG